MQETQLLKGVLEGCVLQMISQKDCYGYELIQQLKQAGFGNMVPGTIYPLLQKLERKKWIKGRMRSSDNGPDRKYFALTEDGFLVLEDFWQQWQGLVEKVQRIKQGDE